MPEKTAKPKIEDVIDHALTGSAQKNALDFVAFLRANKMSPRWASANSWAVSYRNQRICFIRVSGTAQYHHLEKGSWHINHVNYGNTNLISYPDEWEQYIPDDQLKDMVWSHVRYCKKCYNCKGTKTIIILGKQFDDVCHNWMFMKNPDVDTLNCAKKIVIMRRQAIANMGA